MSKLLIVEDDFRVRALLRRPTSSPPAETSSGRAYAGLKLESHRDRAPDRP